MTPDALLFADGRDSLGLINACHMICPKEKIGRAP